MKKKKLLLLILLIILYFNSCKGNFEHTDTSIVEVVEFTCYDSTLYWVTHQEKNISHYEIYISKEGKEWEYNSSIFASGNSNTPILYEMPVDGTYVQLRYIDFNGNFFHIASAYCGMYTE